MPTILKREFAPISDEAWNEIDNEAARTISGVIAGRKVVDFSGPHGWEYAAVNLGRVKLANKKAGPIAWGTREVLPLVEIRVPFTLNQFEIDNLTRGSEDADIAPMLDVVAKAAMFEDDAIFNGFPGGNIPGLIKTSEHKPIKLPSDPEQYPKTVSDAIQAMTFAGVGGPYALVLETNLYYKLRQSAKTGYPPHRTIEEMLGGDIIPCASVKGGVVMSTRGGDFELTVGKDFSIGYASHNRDSVEFFLTESFTFRVLEPKAVVSLTAGA